MLRNLVDFRDDIYKQKELADKFCEFASGEMLNDLQMKSDFLFFIYETLDSMVEDGNKYFEIIFEFYKVDCFEKFYKYWKNLDNKQQELLEILKAYNA